MLFCLKSKNNYFKWLFLLNIARKFLYAFITVYFNKWNVILGIYWFIKTTFDISMYFF